MKSKLTIESSLLNDPNFMKDYELVSDEFEKLFNDPKSQENFEEAKKIYKFFYSKNKEEINKIVAKFLSDPIGHKEELEVLEKYILKNLPLHINSKVIETANGKLLISLATNFKPTTVNGSFYYPNTITLIIPSIPTNLVINDIYNSKKIRIKNTIIHELSHFYKFKYRRSFRKKKRKDFEIGGIDYATYDEERESYLAEMWKEMEDAYRSGKKTFEECLYSSETFLDVLESAGLSLKQGKIDRNKFNALPQKHQQVYKYFLKKLIEKWINSGYSYPPTDRTKKQSLFRRLISKFL